MKRSALAILVAILLQSAISSVASAAGDDPRPRVLVQDFRNRSYEIRYDWVGRGLAYLVRKNLGFVDGLDMLEVRRARPDDAEPIADYVVEGEVRLDDQERDEDDKFVVFVTLDPVTEGGARRQFLTEGVPSQLFDMAEYLADRIGGHLGLNTAAARGRFGRGMTRDFLAYQQFSEALVDRRTHAKLEAYERAVLLDPKFAEAYYHLGRVHTVIRDYPNAEKQLSAAVQLLPEYAEARNDLAYVMAQQGKLDQALAEYRAALRAEPGEARYYLNLGDLLRLRGRQEEARQAYQDALRLRPGDPDATAALIVLEGGTASSPPPPASATQVAGLTATATPRSTPTPAPRSTSTPAPRSTPTPAPRATPPPAPRATPPAAPRATPAPTPRATPAPAPRATPAPTPRATPAPTPRPTPAPTPRPTPAPTPSSSTVASAELAADPELQRELEYAQKILERPRGDRAVAENLVGAAQQRLAAGDLAGFHAALGELYLGQRMRHAALESLRRARALAPDRVDVCRSLADAYRAMGKKTQAAELGCEE